MHVRPPLPPPTRSQLLHRLALHGVRGGRPLLAAAIRLRARVGGLAWRFGLMDEDPMFAVLAEDGLDGGVEWFADLEAAHALVADLLRLPITPAPRLRLVELTATGVETLWTSSWDVPWQGA